MIKWNIRGESKMKRIYARRTTVTQISDDIANEFIQTYHRQGLPKFGKNRYNVGLYTTDNQLVGEASFSNPRTSKKTRMYQQELVRMTFKDDVQVIGGASKMIKFYIDTYRPKNFFTYQTTSGLNSAVYAKCGMTLREKGKTKHILVKNGYTYEQAVQEHHKKGTKYLYLNRQLISHGPDAVLKTHLGRKRIRESNGHIRWMTNEELFINFCNYHSECIPGDNVFDYNNDHYIHYIYIITNNNPNDNHYYIGRHSDHTLTRYSNFSLTHRDISNLINDGYMGSGGSKFKTWKTQTLSDGFKLQKNILSIQQNWSDNLKAEKKEIGDKYYTDDNCLNQICGGIAPNSRSMKRVNTHLFHKATCDIHGLTTFRNDICLACDIQRHAAVTEKTCPIHGLTKFRGERCIKCWTNNATYQAICPIHGRATFRSDMCLKCKNSNAIYYDTCSKHGRTKFKGGKCCKCIAEKTYHDDICPKHGKTTFAGDVCLKCKNENAITYKYCDKCEKVTGWNGNTCMSCINKKMYHEKECPIHGLTKFRGNTCMKCVSAKKPKKPKKVHVTERKYCDKCKKDTRHVDGKCMSCVERALYHQAECPIHGLTKFRANKCCACRAAKMREDRKRKKLEKQKSK